MLAPCLQCGYLIESQRGTRCSECGWVISQIESETMRRRLIQLDRWEKHRRFMLFVWVLIGAFCAMLWGLLLHLNGTDVRQLLWILIALPLIPIVQEGLVRVAASLAPQHQRPLLLSSWYGAMPLMHASWICLIPLGLMLLIVALIGSLLEPGGAIRSGLFVVAGFASITTWLCFAFGGAVSWFCEFSTRCAQCWVHEHHMSVGLIRLIGIMGIVVYSPIGLIIGIELAEALSKLIVIN